MAFADNVMWSAIQHRTRNLKISNCMPHVMDTSPKVALAVFWAPQYCCVLTPHSVRKSHVRYGSPSTLLCNICVYRLCFTVLRVSSTKQYICLVLRVILSRSFSNQSILHIKLPFYLKSRKGYFYLPHSPPDLR